MSAAGGTIATFNEQRDDPTWVPVRAVVLLELVVLQWTAQGVQSALEPIETGMPE